MTKILKNIQVPTGNICIMQGEKGNLEFLSIGDYGKQANIKADFLGIERELNGVPNGKVMPLTEKWVVTISTQYGCSMNCKFCDVPKVGKGVNAKWMDLDNQILSALSLHPEIKHTKRLNIHYARMGEPTWNMNVIGNALELPSLIEPFLGDSLIHPVISTMMPKANKLLFDFLDRWCSVKNGLYQGNAGLQFSINSTDDAQREYLFSGNAMLLQDVAAMAARLPMPKGRKYALNFALADSSIIDEHVLINLFPADKFMCKITPLHDTKSCEENHLQTTGGYRSFTPYKDVETRLKSVGYDVIVFIPSFDEDNGLITCGNAILSGNMPTTDYKLIK